MSDHPPIPMTVLGGWLGAGKTTLLNRMLANAEQRVAVVVNDIGEINVDAALIAADDDEVVELTNGCVCCSIGESLALTLRELTLRNPLPERIVIEASGVADPVQVAAYGDRRRVPLDAIITLADAGTFARRAGLDPYGSLVKAQVAGADLVVATKLDLLDDDTADAGLAALRAATSAPVVASSDDPAWVRDVILGPHDLSDRSGYEVAPPAHCIATRTWRSAEPVDVGALVGALERSGLLRAKGTVTTLDGTMLVHLAGERVEVTPSDGPALDALVLIGGSGAVVTDAVEALDRVRLS